ncbi:porin [Parashewanella curva]|uniref:Porin n=1 Tax=Parashewanella curva TaxID=2338552 RepID=A0A3L8PYM8_9GAMM|nr:porin [Parashewanella curva]RLV59673.1 porin [Parashewanella curva]
MMKKRITLPLSLTALSLAAMGFSTSALADHSHSHTLEKKIETLNKRIEQLEGKKSASKFKNTKFTLYGTVRPTLQYKADNSKGDKDWDLGDALSHMGVSAETDLFDGWTAIAKGEWSIDLSNNGDFGKARQVYAGVATPFGTFAFGKQRPAEYTLIAEYLDIFNHASSPFAFDSNGPFFVNNFATYKLVANDFTIMAAAQVDGDKDTHLINTGVGYDTDNLHIGVAYLNQNDSTNANGTEVMGDKKTMAATVAYTFGNGLYLAASYADIDYEFDVKGYDRSGGTLDTALAYPLNDEYKIKLGYFDFDDGKKDPSSQNYTGYNTTLEWNPANNVRLHLEYLTRDYDNLGDDKILALGVRYDFKLTW